VRERDSGVSDRVDGFPARKEGLEAESKPGDSEEEQTEASNCGICDVDQEKCE
jgi:hypothetical protein